MKKTILLILIAATFIIPLFIMPITVDYYNPAKELLIQLAAILCFALWLRAGILEGRIEFVNTKFYFLLIALCASAAVSFLNAKSVYCGVKDLRLLIAYVFIFFTVLNTVTKKEVRLVMISAVIGGSICAAYAVFQYYGFDFIKYPGITFADWRFKLYSSFGNPDFLADYLILIFPAGISLYVSTERIPKKISFLIALGIMFTGLLITFSVGALIALLLSAVLMACIYAAERAGVQNFICSEKPIEHAGISIVALLLVFWLILAFFFVDNRYHSPGVLKKAMASQTWRHGFENRLNLYRAAYRMARENPYLGVGEGNFKLRLPEYRGRQLSARQEYVDPKILDVEKDANVLNDYLQTLSETGVPGLAILVIVMLVLLRSGISLYCNIYDLKRKYLTLGLMGGLTAFLIHATTSFPMHVAPNAFLFWVFSGLLLCHIPEDDRVSISLNLTMLQKRVYVAILLGAGVFLAVVPVKSYFSDIFLKRMVDLDKKGMIEKALTEARTSLVFDPDSSAITYVGNYAIMNKDYETAASAIRRALQNNDRIDYHIALAQIYQKQNLPKDAMNEYLCALKLNPCYTDIRLKLAELYTDNKMYSEAEAQCQLILINNPEDGALKQKLKSIMQRIFEDKFLSVYLSTAQAAPK